ncbi:hypothetical protein KP509_07G017100 [Ceratopteris richardii]|uniref:BZIP domain-containing protein n=1 Tax=Ceratopteris richardii TaxID=49495 RepID=A0A8T2UEI6_CERRI|nr:hypothetical protein KP509_07G017100 [Ceratopteris richardii]
MEVTGLNPLPTYTSIDRTFLDMFCKQGTTERFLLPSALAGCCSVPCNGHSYPCGSATSAPSLITSPTSEDQQNTQSRKERRMLSNRESARRSRLRKQRHLNELQAHVAKLRAQKRQILSCYNLTLNKLTRLMEDNQTLNSEASSLSRQLQSLQDTLASSHQIGELESTTLQSQILQSNLHDASGKKNHIYPCLSHRKF